MQLDFPVWLRIEHWVNVLFVTLLIRSGIEVLATHPKLYWRNDSRPGTEWARFTRLDMPTDKLYDTLDEEESYSPVLSLPGHKNLGMGRHWHFLSVIGWIATGLVYYVLLFVTGQWHRYVPYSWSIFPTAWNDLLTYLSFDLPPLLPGQPFDAIQKLSYAAVIFLLAPFQILTGAAQSPAVEARFPRYVRLWGGRQAARSLHFFGLLAFVGFIAVHLIMVGLWGWGQLNALMIFGRVRDPRWAIAWSLVIVAAIVLVHVAATVMALKRPRAVQRVLGAVVTGVRKVLLRPLVSKQDYSAAKLSDEHRVNGKPPDTDHYKIMAAHDFTDWTLEVGGLVRSPMTLSLEQLRELGEQQNQRVLHNCIQGWSSIGEWGGLPMRDLVELVEPLPQARYVCLLTMQDTGRDEPSAPGTGRFYEVIDLSLAWHPEALLAYEMNGAPLPLKHGAPLRLRLETQVGFKMAKWIERVEFVSDYSAIGKGMGGWREDNVYFDKNVEI
ncbi:DMSO/TMAO reductase YedYZ molybdopterin-dependent catalytic subunit/thiosulfate reductase cytochrome b subunit [Saccharopolyspora lacisalsi]|uniref:DMSO/TMAO reductase YedYZ molybdopterin-dependent catalytic subunit/thiosulfate reductase cytochrome b subunit n=1 Tax=Halosaccharopolyspora lacisalsi TaxID=1000566 RepID=A0A839DVK4_9PSEU|nr:molybdopterin-dependent oxidoreductase [Halosaccharopolyspora lacisalsi]MBA8824940.1 DMSO/TMAO reductase YedYZ molybdopterin-dependent catalytic subunit/thiosulfate reductase cytochrome b subunit [Halosaccharopolyspora lacisalsi]